MSNIEMVSNFLRGYGYAMVRWSFFIFLAQRCLTLTMKSEEMTKREKDDLQERRDERFICEKFFDQFFFGAKEGADSLVKARNKIVHDICDMMVSAGINDKNVEKGELPIDDKHLEKLTGMLECFTDVVGVFTTAAEETLENIVSAKGMRQTVDPTQQLVVVRKLGLAAEDCLRRHSRLRENGSEGRE